MSSDPVNYGAIDEGLYPANYDKPGKSGSLHSHWVLNHRDRIPTLDGQDNPLYPEQKYENGDGYKLGIFIHSTNQSGYAGVPVSKGCLLLSPNDFKKFNQIMRGVRTFKVQVSRWVGPISKPDITILRHLKKD